MRSANVIDTATGGRAVSATERAWLLIAAGLAAIPLLYPLWTDPYSLSVVRDALIFGLFALSLDFLWGKAGILSFGHAAFFGVGAYGTAIVAPMVGGDAAGLVGCLAAIAMAVGIAAIVGYFLIFGGVRGAYFTIVTLALSLVAQHIVIGWARVTGGDAGLIGTPPPGIGFGQWSVVLADPVSQHYLVLAISLAAVLAIWTACRGQYGRVLAAIRGNELRAKTLGHHTSLHLLIVLMLSAGLAALAGGLYAMVSGFVAPDLIGLLLSTEVIVWVAIGGRGTLIGPFIGAFVVLRLQQEVSSFNPRLWPLLIGAFFVAMVFLFPNGLLPLFERAWERLRAAARRRGHTP